VWNLAGHVTLRITILGGSNPVVSGLLFGGSPQQNFPPALNLVTNALNFSGVAGGSNPGAQNIAIANSAARGASLRIASPPLSSQDLSLFAARLDLVHCKIDAGPPGRKRQRIFDNVSDFFDVTFDAPAVYEMVVV